MNKIPDTNWNSESVGLLKSAEELGTDMNDLVDTSRSIASQVDYAAKSLKVAEENGRLFDKKASESDVDPVDAMLAKLASTPEGADLIKQAKEVGRAKAYADIDALVNGATETAE